MNGISAQNVTSNAVTVTSNTQYNSSSSTSTIIGYTFSNTLAVRIGDLTTDKLSQVLDTSVANGGNNLTVTSVDFSLSTELSRAKNIEAQQAATDDANSTAQQYAKVISCKPQTPTIKLIQKYCALLYCFTPSRSCDLSSLLLKQNKLCNFKFKFELGALTEPCRCDNLLEKSLLMRVISDPHEIWLEF